MMALGRNGVSRLLSAACLFGAALGGCGGTAVGRRDAAGAGGGGTSGEAGGSGRGSAGGGAGDPDRDRDAAAGATLDAASDAALDAASHVAFDAGSDANGVPFPTKVRVVNAGATDFLIYYDPSFACPLGFMIRSDTPPTLPSTSLEPPDTTCDCSTCGLGLGGGPRCVSNDLLCDDPPITVVPGGIFTFSWDGTVLTWFDPAAGADCPIRCSRFTAVPPGTYVFSLTQPTGTFESAPTPLPSPGGSIDIQVNAPSSP
jgi:hypothetical protein